MASVVITQDRDSIERAISGALEHVPLEGPQATVMVNPRVL